MTKTIHWGPARVLQFLENCRSATDGFYSSAVNGPPTLYATSYAVLINRYIGIHGTPDQRTIDVILDCQDPRTGYFIGPEIRDWSPSPEARHDRLHLLRHLTCTVLPVLQEYGIKPRFPLQALACFCDRDYLQDWMDKRNMANAWLEGNNLLFIGQLLLFLRDAEGHGKAQSALDLYFDWLDRHVDPATGLWGTDGRCSPFVAMCGAYHQLLVYNYENRPVSHREKLVDTVLGLQHPDGGFSPHGGGGACEDVDAVDILVNMFKQMDYRRAEISYAVRRCLRQLLQQQNPDGGFPYGGRPAPFTHMGIPDTASPSGASNMFSTWFRVHTVALATEVLQDEPCLQGCRLGFNSSLSMGWHRPWDTDAYPLVRHSIPALVTPRVTYVRICLRHHSSRLLLTLRTLAGRAKRRARRLLYLLLGCKTVG